MSRSIKDAACIKNKALPAAGATAYTDTLDLGTAAVFPSQESFSVRLAVPATATLVSGKAITLSIEDSANGTDFAAVTGLSALIVTGTGGNVSAATERDVMLPPGVRRYVRASASVESGGGNNTGTEFVIEFLF